MIINKIFVLTIRIIVALKILHTIVDFFYFERATFVNNVFIINYFNNINIDKSVVLLVYLRQVVFIWILLLQIARYILFDQFIFADYLDFYA